MHYSNDHPYNPHVYLKDGITGQGVAVLPSFQPYHHYKGNTPNNMINMGTGVGSNSKKRRSLDGNRNNQNAVYNAGTRSTNNLYGLMENASSNSNNSIHGNQRNKSVSAVSGGFHMHMRNKLTSPQSDSKVRMHSHDGVTSNTNGNQYHNSSPYGLMGMPDPTAKPYVPSNTPGNGHNMKKAHTFFCK